MKLTLLVDLDDTLLGNEMSTFLPAYLQALGEYLSSYAEPERLVATLLSATQQMIQKSQPDRSLEETFDAIFYDALGVSIEEIQGAIDTFYANIFPRLQSHTVFLPQAVDFVEQAVDLGYEIVIATNPLFPRTAILQRLNWAGISLEKYPLRLVTSVENFHFAKPNPAYFAEILAQLGWPDQPAVMVGDDLHNDIIPARQIGIPAFWITSDGSKISKGSFGPTSSGTLENVLPWLQSTSYEQLIPNFETSLAQSATMRATPAALSSLAQTLPDTLLTECPQAGEWCLTEIICHLRDVDNEVNLPRIRTIIQEVNPFLPGVDTDPWAKQRQYICQNGRDALVEFAKVRIEILSLLDDLTNREWQRIARHAILGPTSLQELVSIIASHDRLHLQQIHETLKSVVQLRA